MKMFFIKLLLTLLYPVVVIIVLTDIDYEEKDCLNPFVYLKAIWSMDSEGVSCYGCKKHQNNKK